MSFINNSNARDGILSCEQMVAKALSEVGHRKGLSEVEIFQHMRRHFHYQIGTDYTQTKLNVRQVLKRGTALGTIQEVKGFGSWSLYRISEKKQKKYPLIEKIKEHVGLKRELSSPDDSSASPKKVPSSYSLRTPVVRTPHPSLSQKSTVSHRPKEEGQKSVSSPGSSSHLDSIKNSKFKTPIWKKPIPEYPSTIASASFETPLSVLSPAYIKFKKIGIHSTSTTTSVARLHHRKVAMEHPTYEEMIEMILTQLGERKALSEADIFKYLVHRFRVGKDYAKIKADLKQAIRRGVIFGTIKEVKGYGQWSTFQIAEKENDYLSAVSAKHTHHLSTASQNIISASSPMRMPSEMRSQMRTPIWKKSTCDSLNDSLSSSPSLNSSFSSNLSTSLSFDGKYFEKSELLAYEKVDIEKNLSIPDTNPIPTIWPEKQSGPRRSLLRNITYCCNILPGDLYCFPYRPPRKIVICVRSKGDSDHIGDSDQILTLAKEMSPAIGLENKQLIGEKSLAEALHCGKFYSLLAFCGDEFAGMLNYSFGYALWHGQVLHMRSPYVCEKYSDMSLDNILIQEISRVAVANGILTVDCDFAENVEHNPYEMSILHMFDNTRHPFVLEKEAILQLSTNQ